MSAGRWIRVAALLVTLVLVPGHAFADWLDQMPSVGAVAEVIDRAFDTGALAARSGIDSRYGATAGPESAVAITMAQTLILLRALMEYRVIEDPSLTASQRARIQRIADTYIQVELAIGRHFAMRRGAPDEVEVRRVYQSLNFRACPSTAECYRYWLHFHLQSWGAASWRDFILPRLFPCGRSAQELEELFLRHFFTAPAPVEYAAPQRPYERAAVSKIPPPSTKPAVCTADGEDIDGDGLCDGWEASIKKARLASTSPDDRCADAPFKLLRASTEDGASLQIRYTVGFAFEGRPIRLTACRTSDPTYTTCEGEGAELLGRDTIWSPAELSPGEHEVTILSGLVLKPDPNRPYVVISGESAGHTSAAYFQKRLVGIVVHGYTFRYTIELSQPFPDVSTVLQDKLIGKDEGESWQTEMVASLRHVSCYDATTFAFDWRFESVQRLKSLLTSEGRRLLDRMTTLADELRREHDGDVVDFHLIGHSRGTVIISEALKEQAQRFREALRGSYLRVTLLDPHPANNEFLSQQDVEENSVVGRYFYSKLRETQDELDDPAIALPADIGIREVQVWYQQTRVKDLLEAHALRDWLVSVTRMTLWGLGGSTRHYIEDKNESGVEIQWYDLTKLPRPDGSLTDHLGVVLVYQDEINRVAVPDRCVLPRP